MKIAVIGGGASGLCAAIEAKRSCKTAKITVFEHLPKVCKKILVTGNGRCNFTNENLSLNHFYGNEKFIENVIGSACGNTTEFFRSLGVLPYCEDGRIYPRSQQSSTIREALLNEAEALGINIITNANITSINKKNNIFCVNGQAFDAVIIAGGGKASPVQGSDGSCYKLLTDFGHTLNTPAPALCGLTTGEKFIHLLKGVRVEAKASLYSINKLLGEESGEIQFTEKSVSGIPVMNLSHLAHEKKRISLHLDLCEEFSENELIHYIRENQKNSPEKRIENLLSGIINQKAGYVVIDKANIKPNTVINTLNFNDIERIAAVLKDFKINISGTRDFSNAQITCGGISTEDFYPENMMSKLCDGLFACGEILNIHGDCGGYNLHLAWVTGRLAGKGAAEFIIKQKV